MSVVEDFPHRVREIENCWIPLSDGCRLAARIWLPEDAEIASVPAILEYIPYRKRDFTRPRDEPMHRYFAGHGYAAVRVDLRGSGDSDGLLLDEYLQQEHDDALEVIAWIAAQPWCSGAVGMMGKSWGGFNSLQVAARQPRALKAIITVCAADDRYADDAHYMGGCLLNENLIWGSVLLSFNAYPPDSYIVGERWRETWLQRLQHAVLFPEVWLSHQRRDHYWKHGSVCEDFAAIACPVYAIGGWADAYSNAVPRLLAGLEVPRKGLIGPWAHVYPHDGVPGPAIGFLQEALRWWDHWLKGLETGIMDEPMYRVWMQESVPPKAYYQVRPGRWVAEAEWPSSRIVGRRFALNQGRLDERVGPEAPLSCRTPQTLGLAAGDWCGFGAEDEMPTDQQEDDAGSLTFDSDPLDEGFDILGAPVVTLELAADRSNALIAVRLNDVAPDGASTRVSYGLMNLTHRHSHEHPEPLQPGRRYRVEVRLNDIAHAFPAGHRIRVAVSTSYWPTAWPSPEPVTVTVFAGKSTLDLPVRPSDPDDDNLRPFGPPERAAAPQCDTMHPPTRRTIERDPETGEAIYAVSPAGEDRDEAPSGRLEAIDLDIGHIMAKRYRIRADDPLSAEAETTQRTQLRRGDWAVWVEVHTRLRSTKTDFQLHAEVSAYEGDEPVFTKCWNRTVPRDLV